MLVLLLFHMDPSPSVLNSIFIPIKIVGNEEKLSNEQRLRKSGRIPYLTFQVSFFPFFDFILFLFFLIGDADRSNHQHPVFAGVRILARNLPTSGVSAMSCNYITRSFPS